MKWTVSLNLYKLSDYFKSHIYKWDKYVYINIFIAFIRSWFLLNYLASIQYDHHFQSHSYKWCKKNYIIYSNTKYKIDDAK